MLAHHIRDIDDVAWLQGDDKVVRVQFLLSAVVHREGGKYPAELFDDHSLQRLVISSEARSAHKSHDRADASGKADRAARPREHQLAFDGSHRRHVLRQGVQPFTEGENPEGVAIGQEVTDTQAHNATSRNMPDTHAPGTRHHYTEAIFPLSR